MKTWMIIAVIILALMPVAFAQNPIESVIGPAKEKVNEMGTQLQQQAVQNLVEANLTKQRISHEFNAAKQDVTTKVTEKLDQTRKALQHTAETNITRELIYQEFNATKQNLTEHVAEKLNQTINKRFNQTPEELQQNITEELKKRLNQKVPGFEFLAALIGLVCLALAVGRKN